MPASTALAEAPVTHASPPDDRSLDAVTRRVVSDLHTPRPVVFWTDMLSSAVVGWGAFVVATVLPPFDWRTFLAVAISALALYRGLCFIHEITHLRRRAVPGFETCWNLLFGVPLMLPTFTYVGVHQSHHSLATYGTRADPEYLPFRRSRRLIVIFSLQASVLFPAALLLRFLVLAPVGLVWPPFHRWLEARASSFAMNPGYRRSVTPAAARSMRVWEGAILLSVAAVIGSIGAGYVPFRVVGVWYGMLALVCFLNTMRVLGAHEYETDGASRDRHGQLRDSIDTPGGPWTELWAPVGLRYHALHHYFPGIPYHNLGLAYRRIAGAIPPESPYFTSTSPSLRRSLSALYRAARRGYSAWRDW